LTGSRELVFIHTLQRRLKILTIRFCRPRLVLLIALLFCPFAAQSQKPASQNSSSGATLQIRGDVEQTLKLGASELAKLPRRTGQAKDHNGSLVKFEGVALVEALKLAGVPFGDLLKGRNLTKYLLVEAADAYQVVFALPELDPAYTDKFVLLADRRDGQPLANSEGAFRLVVPDEKMQARWLRQITTLTVIRATDEKAKSGAQQ
jgi:DMSO/TMAO reductase YedYZ molybdopterin-dependent catalytic subunit